MTTLAELRAAANPETFPVDLVRGSADGIAFYAAGFLGRNDVIHLASIPFVVLVDTDETKLMEMHAVYPERWAYHAGNARDFAQKLADDGESFDVVTVDPWSNDTTMVLNDLPLWLSLAKRALVIATCFPWFESKGLGASLEDVNRWIARSHWGGKKLPAASRLVWRSSYRGGVWWIVFDLAAMDVDPWSEPVPEIGRG